MGLWDLPIPVLMFSFIGTLISFFFGMWLTGVYTFGIIKGIWERHNTKKCI